MIHGGDSLSRARIEFGFPFQRAHKNTVARSLTIDECPSKPKLVRATSVAMSMEALLKGQLKFMKDDFEVIGVSSFDRMMFGKIRMSEGIDLRVVEMSRKITPWKDLRSLWRMYLLLRREKPTIVHTHTPKAGTIGMLAAWLCKTPVRMHTVAGLPLLESRGLKRKVLSAVEKVTYGCATRVYPNSLGLMNIIIENGLADRTKLRVIANGSSNGIDTAYYSPEHIDSQRVEQLRQRYCLMPDHFVYIFIGRLVKDKGISELVSAFVSLNLKHSLTRLLLVGPPEHEIDPLDTSTINAIKNHTSIKYAGFQEDVRPFLAASNVLVLPSYREGLPNAPLQACAMNRPCIVSDINGCNEIITHEQNGLLIRPKDTLGLGNAMERVLLDKELYDRLASRARDSIRAKYDQKLVWQDLKMEYFEQIKTAAKLQDAIALDV